MKTSLSHLPENKQKEILEIVEIIKNGVQQVEKVILFGSYATGNWVEDSYFEDGIRYDYISDYDFLIVTKDDNEKEYELIEKILSHCRNKFKIPVSPIIHSIKYINSGIEEGQYFFTEIVEQGILLFDTGSTSFVDGRKLTITEQKEIAHDFFNTWFTKGSNFLRFTKLIFEDLKARDEVLNDAAYILHQAAERFYNCTLLVFYSYKPKTHNLDKLRRYVKSLSQELFEIFPYPTEDKGEQHLFDLLKRAYIDARYKSDYKITEKELLNLINRVELMENIVGNICKRRIDTLA